MLKQIFPQGLEQTDPPTRKRIRQAYDEWREAIDTDDPDSASIHDAWIELVLKRVLELDENGDEDVLKPKGALPESISVSIPEHEVTLLPDYAVVNGQDDGLPLMFVTVYPPDTDLSLRVKGDSWAASPVERMVELCRARDVRLGLVTDGERWTLVDAPIGGVTSNASWYARLWGQEPITLQAFVNLLGIRRFFVDDSERLPSLLDESLKLQEEVNDALGEQVRRAVEVLVQRLDRADLDLNRELLTGVEPTEIYEAALTVMMRVVFLLSAEERGLLLLDDEAYQTNYAVSTLRMHLRAESEEILERRQDAWSRLLAIFRAVYGGIEHETLKLPALGGSLFDPDRFPFLEGRSKGTTWKEHPAAPLPIDNRTVLLLLDAVQLIEGRTLSYRGLDIEQIGYVYEGLLERTVVRAHEVTLDLDATKSAKNPWVTLDELESTALAGRSAVQALLEDRTGSSSSRVKNDLAKSVDEAAADRLLTACHGSQTLRDRIRPYLHFLRMDRWGYPLVYPDGTFMVTAGMNRRETGTHYTPKSLTESIVKETLEPLVYVGPADGMPRKDWRLRPSGELLDLKICDPTMGSGAFLVQVCRWLSERLVEAWDEAETAGQAITSDGEVVDEIGELEPLRDDAEDRMLVARRLIAERCLYGIDMNPLAVELAKLSIWLITLAKGRPFGFLDHNLRCGDSLLGIHDLDQLLYLEVAPGKNSSKKLFATKIDAAVERALELRAELRSHPTRDIRDVELMASLDERARQELEIPQFIADAFVGDLLAGSTKPDMIALSIEAGKAIDDPDAHTAPLIRRAQNGLHTDRPHGQPPRRSFHWPLEFPEAFQRGHSGFNAMVGNPPFIYGKNITRTLGGSYNTYLTNQTPNSTKNVDISAHFLFRAFTIVNESGCVGLICTSSIAEGDTRKGGLVQVQAHGASIYSAHSRMPWPGKANVLICIIHLFADLWKGTSYLNGKPVSAISSYLTSVKEGWSPVALNANKKLATRGVVPNGSGFFLTRDEAERLLNADNRYEDVIMPFLVGEDLNSTPDQSAGRFIINFWDWTFEESSRYPDALEIVRAKVKPHRDTLGPGKKKIKENWWLYEAAGKDMFVSLGTSKFKYYKGDVHGRFDKAIAIARVSKTGAFTLVNTHNVFAEVIVFASDNVALFAILQSNIHVAFAWEQAGKMKNDLRYSPSLCFLPFPLPETDDTTLHSLGSELFDRRTEMMQDLHIGLTKFYKEFHNPWNADTRLVELRRLQAEIDRRVATAYCWSDLDLGHEFHEVAYLPDGDRLRFTISEQARFTVLKKLAALNKERYQEEQASGFLRSQNRGTKRVKEGVNASGTKSQGAPGLFDASTHGETGHRHGIPREDDTRRDVVTSSNDRKCR